MLDEEPKFVRREHKIDDRHRLVFEAKLKDGWWMCRAQLRCNDDGGYPLMDSVRSYLRSADRVAAEERAWVERFRGMGE